MHRPDPQYDHWLLTLLLVGLAFVAASTFAHGWKTGCFVTGSALVLTAFKLTSGK